MLGRAAEADRRRRFGDPLTIENPTAQKTEQLPDNAGRFDGYERRFADGSQAGRRQLVDGQWVEVHFSAPVGRILSVR